ncbi:hypothetical protein BC829DRAFT_416284 [Chytridium lagenaria]|nr:hypothetical protein BC829DRAFT_416284 [Chytridium lagenaria]
MTFVLQDDPPSYRDYVNQLTSRLALAKSILLRESMKRRESASEKTNKSRHRFEIGDLVWLSVPLRTEAATKDKESTIKKFQFRWAGPMRVIGHSPDNFRFNLVETLPDGRLLARTANSARMHDFEAEIEAWKSLRIVQRRPKTKVAVGVNRELFRRFDADVLEADIDDPEFYVEKIDNHTFHKERMSYEYHIKWLGQGTSHNLWLEEVEIPALLVQDYWNQMATKDPHEYRDRLRFTSKKGIPKRTKPFLDILLPLITMDMKVTTVKIRRVYAFTPLTAGLSLSQPHLRVGDPRTRRLGSRIYPTIAVWVPGTPPPCEGETASRRMRPSRIGAHANGEKVAYAGPDYCDRHRRLSPGASWMQDIRLFPSLLRWCEGKTIRSGWSVLTAVWCQEYLLSQVASRGLQ